MRISPITNKTFKPINFGTTERTKYITGRQKVVVKPFYDKGCDFLGSEYGRILVSNSTRFFRNDLSWGYLGQKLDDLFPNDEPVNVFNFACSDGSEPHSLAICLIEQLGEDGAKRFFPINASDVDSEIIPSEKNNQIIAEAEDIERIKKVTNGNIKKYFSVKRKGEKMTTAPNGAIGFEKEEYILTPKKILKDNVKFSCENFYDGLDNLKSKNNLVLCRNFWGYLEEDEILNCAKKLYKKLDDSSIVIIGDFDLDNGAIPKFLTDLGIDSQGDLWLEENILKKHEGYSDGNYRDELLANVEAYGYHRRKC